MQVISAKFIKLPVSVGMDYNTELQRIVAEIKRDIDALLVPALRAEQPNYVTDATWFDRLAAILRRIRERYESPQFRALTDVIARRFVNAVDMRVTKSMGMDVYGNNEALQTVIEASIYDNVRLIKTIPEQYLSQVESIVVTNARAGVRSSAIASQLTQQFGVTSRRAKFIARDQTAKVNSAVAQKRIVAAGYEYFEWRTSRDALVRDRHTQIANKVTEYGRGIYRYDNPPLSDKGEPILPGTDYQCFPGESQLDNTTFCNNIYRRWYTGELTELVFNDGTVLRSTINHPILTDRGFKAAHLIDVTDNVIRTRNESFLTVELNRQGVIPTFEEIFSALDFSGVKHGVSTSVHGEFHGDTSDGDINVIKLDSLLRDVINPAIREKLGQFDLTGSDEKVIFDAFSCFGEGNFLSVSFRTSFSRLMSRLNLSVTSFLAHFTPLECFGLTLGTWFDTEAFEMSTDNIAGNTKMFSDCVLAFSVLVHGYHVLAELVTLFLSRNMGSCNTKIIDRSTQHIDGYTSEYGRIFDGFTTTYKLDSIIEKRRVSFSGHVYNLQTISGDYNTSATVVSNCRCTQRPVSQREVDRNKERGLTAPGVKR